MEATTAGIGGPYWPGRESGNALDDPATIYNMENKMKIADWLSGIDISCASMFDLQWLCELYPQNMSHAWNVCRDPSTLLWIIMSSYVGDGKALSEMATELSDYEASEEFVAMENEFVDSLRSGEYTSVVERMAVKRCEIIRKHFPDPWSES